MRIKLALLIVFNIIIFISFPSPLNGQEDSLRQKISYYKNNNDIQNMLKSEVALSRHLLFFTDDLDGGIQYANEVLQRADSYKDDFTKARIHHFLGYTYINFNNDYEKGLKNYFKALEFYDQNEDYEHKSTLLMNLANAYYNYSSYEEAIKFLFQGLEMAEENNDARLIAEFQNNLGANYQALMDTRTASVYWQKASKYYEEIGDELSYYQVQVNIIGAKDFEDLTKENRANFIQIYEKAIPIFKNEGDYYSMFASMKNLASVYNNIGEYSKANEILVDLLSYKDDIQDLLILSEVYSSMATSYSGLGNAEKEAEYLKKYVGMYDTLFNIAKTKAIAETRTKYQAEKIENENNLLKQKEEIQEAKLENEKLTRYGLVVGLGLIVLFALFVMNRFMASQKQKKIIQEQKTQVDTAFTILEAKNNEILDSINYAKRIQAAILPSKSMIEKYLPDSFVFYRPKDIVAGDFYWLEPIQDIGLGESETKDMGVLFAVADCTGHGVPGAMVSVVCNNGLNRSVREHGLTDPADILDKTREIVIKEFGKSEDEVKDGMDIALVNIEKSMESQEEFNVSFAGANNPLWIIRKDEYEVEEIKADKQPIGKFAHHKPFTSKKVKLAKGDTIYVFSDGFADQFGGEPKKPAGKKLKSKNFKNLLISVKDLPIHEQREKLENFFENWMGDLEQLDDVCVIGVRL